MLWLECNAAELNGVSFTKGCFVGQENTARMNWRAKVNRRLVVVETDAPGPRTRVHYPELGLAVEHRRIDDLAGAIVPEWLKAALVSRATRRRAPGRSPCPRTLGGAAVKRKPLSGRRRGWSYARRSGCPAPSSARMHRPRAYARIVDIVAVDPDQRRALRDQPFGGFDRQEGMIVIISVAAPMPVPAGVDQHRLARDVEAVERSGLDREPVFPRLPDDDAGRSRKGFGQPSSAKSSPSSNRWNGASSTCRYSRPCRSARSGRSSRRRNSPPIASRESRSRRCAGPGRPL